MRGVPRFRKHLLYLAIVALGKGVIDAADWGRADRQRFVRYYDAALLRPAAIFVSSSFASSKPEVSKLLQHLVATKNSKWKLAAKSAGCTHMISDDHAFRRFLESVRRVRPGTGVGRLSCLSLRGGVASNSPKAKKA